MFNTLARAFQNREVRTKILITLGLLALYRLGCWLPIPGVNGAIYKEALETGDSFLGLLSQITGGALANGTVLAIGISPYINASIIIQLLTVAIPPLERLSKEGEQGRRKITQITRYFTMALALAQGIGIVLSFRNNNAISTSIFVVNIPEWLVCTMVVIVLMAGSAFTMWLGERITEVGVGNGISLLIFIGITATAGLNIMAVLQGKIFASGVSPETRMGGIWELIGFFLLVLCIFTLIIYVDRAERKIPVSYAKQIKGRKQYGGQSSSIPIKVNASGVLPIIFATAIITFPQLVCQLFFSETNSFYVWYSTYMGTGGTTGNPSFFYIIVMAILILFFSYFYSQIQFNPEEVAKNIQQYGGFIPGIRPGKPTSDYLKKISGRITLFGAIFLTFIALVPSLIFRAVLHDTVLVNAFSATGLLIVVSVALEFNKQLDSLLMMKQYKGFLK